MAIEDDELRVYNQLLRKGICPACGGRLEPPRLPRVYASIPSGGWTGWRERTCYDCGDVFGYYPYEE